MNTCDACAADAVVFAPGSDEVRQLFLLVRGVPLRCWCLPCAQAAGWPWIASEQPRKRRVA